MITNDALQHAVEKLREALKPHFKGRNAPARLEAATADALQAINHLITTRNDAPKNKLGATVMTEGASANKTIPPRTV